jgi:hypothetical protein
MNGKVIMIIALLMLICLSSTLVYASVFYNENYTTYTEQDAGNLITSILANSFTFTPKRTAYAWLNYDKGPANILSIETFRVEVKSTFGDLYNNGFFWAVSNSTGSSSVDIGGISDFLGMSVYKGDLGNYIWLYERDGGTYYTTSWTAGPTANVWYYIEIIKSGTSLTAKIYSTPDYTTTLVSTLSLNLHHNGPWRYLWGASTSYAGGADRIYTVYVANLAIKTHSVSVIIDSSPQGLGFVLVDSGAITTPHTYTWEVGDSHTLAANSPVNLISGESQYIYSSWSDGGAQSHNYIVSIDATVTANFQLQYYLTVTGGYSPTGQGWYNSGVNVNPSNPWIWSATGNNRTALINWSLDSSNQNPSRLNTGTFTTPNIAMSTYHTVNFISIIQYHLNLSSTINDLTVNQSGSQTLDSWYDDNSNSTVTANTPDTIGDILFTFKHWYWYLGASLQTNSTDNPFEITMSNYTVVSAYWLSSGVTNINNYAPITLFTILAIPIVVLIMALFVRRGRK